MDIINWESSCGEQIPAPWQALQFTWGLSGKIYSCSIHEVRYNTRHENLAWTIFSHNASCGIDCDSSDITNFHQPARVHHCRICAKVIGTVGS